MNDTLKVAGRIGAELGAAKAENERLREVLRCIADLPMDRCITENDYRLSAAKAIALGALSQQAEQHGSVYIECRQCDECQHGGINDSASGLASCHNCDWTGPEPTEDKCPGCQSENCMAAACPECGARYVLVASEDIAALSQQAEPKCSTCNDVGIIGHSDICPECADTWKQQTEPAPAQDEKAAFDDWYPLGCPGAGVTAHLSARAGFRAGAAWQRTRPAQTEQQPVVVPEDFQPLETIRWWISAYTNPENGPSYQGHGMMVQMLCEYEALRIMLSSRAQQWPTAYPHEAMDKLATDRYRVGSAGAGTLHRYAVRAGDGEQELYRGSESDCQNVARKLAGAFLDGGLAFQAMLAAPIAQTAPQLEQSWLVDMVRLALHNGQLVPDPEMDGSTEVFGIKIDDMEALEAALSAQGESHE